MSRRTVTFGLRPDKYHQGVPSDHFLPASVMPIRNLRFVRDPVVMSMVLAAALSGAVMSTQQESFVADGTWTAPSTLIGGTVTFDVYGGSGAGPRGGLGGHVSGTLPATAGVTVFTISMNSWGVGGNAGTSTGAASPAGAGGNAAAVLNGSTPLLVAGGGGGQGGFEGGTGPYAGGIGGQTPTSGQGGTGANNDGGAGTVPTLSAEGSGGTGGGSSPWAGTAGGNGSTHAGGNGGNKGSGTSDGGGGGGGGGYNGGGGGGGGGESSVVFFGSSGGGGAGGLSYAANTVSDPQFNDGVQNGGPVVVVTFRAVDAPGAPSLVGPGNGVFIDVVNAPWTVAWTYNPGEDSGTQKAYCLLVQPTGGAVSYWNAGTSAFGATQVWNACSATTASVQIPANKLTNNNTYQWSLATQESAANTQGPFSNPNMFTAQQQPTATITSPTSTPGPTFNVTWTASTPGGSQATYRVLVYPLAATEVGSFVPGLSSGAVFDTGVVSSTATTVSVTSAAGLIISDQYVVYVQITQAGPIYSSWASKSITATGSAPDVPTVSTASSADPVTGLPRAAVTVTGDSSLSGFTNPFANVTYSDDAGATWTAVRNATAVPVPGSHAVTVYDYEAPLNRQRLYQAQLGGTASGTVSLTAWSAAVGCTVTALNSWVHVPLAITNCLALHRAKLVGGSSPDGAPVSWMEDKPQVQGIFHCLGRSDTFIVDGDSWLSEFDLSLSFFGDTEFDTFDDMRDLKTTLCVRNDMGGVYYIRLGGTRPALTIRDAERVTDPTRQLVIHCYPQLVP